MKPHVIIIMADQLRYDVLGQGYTPSIDSISADGIEFSRAYTNCPLCVPARGTFFTGIYPNKNGSLINPWEPEDANYGYVKEGIDNLYTLMETEWDSLHSGKQHLFTEGGKLEDRADSRTKWLSTERSYKEFLKNDEISAPGGARYRSRVPEMVDGRNTRVSNYSNAETGCYEGGEKYYFDSYFTQKALEGLKSRDTSKPLLLNAMFLAPHPPLDIPAPWYDKIKKDSFDLPENVGVFYPNQSPLQMYQLTGIIGSHYSREQWKESWRVYLGLVSMLDHCVGLLLEELKAQGIYDNSLIIFTSDHGEMLGSHGLFQKMCMYEESVRVPFYLKMPKDFVYAQKSYYQVVSHVDIMPTLCEYLEIETKNKMDGRSLMPVLNGEIAEGNNETVLIQYDGNGSRSNFQRCIVQGKYKLIVDLFKGETFYELYDLEADSQEKNNLLFTGLYDKVARKLMSQLAAHMMESEDLLSLPSFQPQKFRDQYAGFPAL